MPYSSIWWKQTASPLVLGLLPAAGAIIAWKFIKKGDKVERLILGSLAGGAVAVILANTSLGGLINFRSGFGAYPVRYRMRSYGAYAPQVVSGRQANGQLIF